MKQDKDFILIDLETQRDFFMPDGSFYTPRAGEVRKNIYTLFDWARCEHIPVISSVLRFHPGDLGPLGSRPHCVEGTSGERKLLNTTVHPMIDLGMRNSTDLPDNLFDCYNQIIIEKRASDLFLHARAERLFTEFMGSGKCFVLCGADVAGGLTLTALGLRNRGFGVVLAADGFVSPGKWDSANLEIPRMQAKGVVFMRTQDIISDGRAMAKSFRTAKSAKGKKLATSA